MKTGKCWLTEITYEVTPGWAVHWSDVGLQTDIPQCGNHIYMKHICFIFGWHLLAYMYIYANRYPTPHLFHI